MSKVYIASPLFNDEQIARIIDVETLLAVNHIDYFSPRNAQYDSEDEGLNIHNAKMIFNNNVMEVSHCDTLIAILDDKDTGTAWEIGMAYALSKRIILVQFDKDRVSKTNIMLSNCGNGLVHISQLIEEYEGTNDEYMEYKELE